MQEEHNGAKGHLPPPCELFLTKDPTSPKAIWVVHKALLREVFLLCEEEGSGGPPPQQHLLPLRVPPFAACWIEASASTTCLGGTPELRAPFTNQKNCLKNNRKKEKLIKTPRLGSPAPKDIPQANVFLATTCSHKLQKVQNQALGLSPGGMACQGRNSCGGPTWLFFLSKNPFLN